MKTEPPALHSSFTTHRLPLFSGSSNGRTVGSEPANRGSNPFPETISILDCRFWILDQRHRSGEVARCNPKSKIHNLKFCKRTRSPTGRGACLRNKLMKVRIFPRAPVGFGFRVSGFELFSNHKLETRNREPEPHFAYTTSPTEGASMTTSFELTRLYFGPYEFRK